MTAYKGDVHNGKTGKEEAPDCDGDNPVGVRWMVRIGLVPDGAVPGSGDLLDGIELVCCRTYPDHLR